MDCGKNSKERILLKRLWKICSYILVAVLSASIALSLAGNNRAYPKLEELKSVIDRYFVDTVDHAAVEDAAAAAIVEALGDRWSYYMTAEEYKAYQEKMANAYVGIGITIMQQEDGYIAVIKVEPSGPAAEAGLLPGDVIKAVAGQDIASLDMEQIKSMVKGNEGTKVKLQLLRGEEILEKEVERRTIQSIVAKGQMLSDGIGLVTIANFDSRCAKETIAAIEQLQQQCARALIFDVRFNPGGYKKELIEILDYLLPEGPLFRSVNYDGKEKIDRSDENCLQIPMAVLINGDTYSAAEFFGAALSEYGVAKLVGQPTIGKGHYQTSFKLSDGSAAVISIGKYCTPNGVSLSDVGLTPDVLIEVDAETYESIYVGMLNPEDDPQVQAAIAVLSE